MQQTPGESECSTVGYLNYLVNTRNKCPHKVCRVCTHRRELDAVLSQPVR